MDINALPNNEKGVGRYSVVGGEGELQIWAVEAIIIIIIIIIIQHGDIWCFHKLTVTIYVFWVVNFWEKFTLLPLD